MISYFDNTIGQVLLKEEGVTVMPEFAKVLKDNPHHGSDGLFASAESKAPSAEHQLPSLVHPDRDACGFCKSMTPHTNAEHEKSKRNGLALNRTFNKTGQWWYGPGASGAPLVSSRR